MSDLTNVNSPNEPKLHSVNRKHRVSVVLNDQFDKQTYDILSKMAYTECLL